MQSDTITHSFGLTDDRSPVRFRARSDAPFSKMAPASFGQFWQFLKTVAENLAGAVFENGASDRALKFLRRDPNVA